MHKFTLLFGVLLCLVAVNARHFDRHEDESLENEEETLRRQKEHSPMRHRRRRWQANYGYDYSPPSYYYPDRRYSDRYNQEVLQNIYKLLEEISTYIHRPPPTPPPPQPIYIPYPISFNIPQIKQVPKPCSPPKTDQKNPNITLRIPAMEDSNQNWGLVVSNENDYDDGSDGSRPISFDPIVPKQFMKRPSPEVEHGSVQASFTTAAPKFLGDAPAASSNNIASPGMCNAAVLSCCGISTDKSQQRQCFSNIGCSMTFDDGSVCTPAAIQKALESFRLAYSPVN